MQTRIDNGRERRRRVLGILRTAAMLVASLILMLSGAAGAETNSDSDPFDRPGFYIGGGGTYQFNAFSSRIEDVIDDAVNDATGGSNASFNLEESGGLNALIGYRVWSWFAVELQYEWVDEYDIEGSVDLLVPIPGTLYSIEGHALTLNTKWIIPFWRVQPYLLIGGGMAISEVSTGDLSAVVSTFGGEINDGTNIKPAARAGLGLDLHITQHIVLNAQVSAVVTTLKSPEIGDVDDLNYMSFAAGLEYRF